jgi:folate-binding protein YgfZ
MTDSLFASILVSGPDTRTFLQGQLTCDIDTLTREKPLLACINSAQGRVQAVLDVIERDEGIVLSVVASMAERTVQRLRKYVLRSKVKIELSPVSVSGFFSHAPNPTPHSPLLSQIHAGIPHVFSETHESFVAQMLNLDVLGGISFEKGCYTGQEIIARAHFRGAVKRRMFRFSAECAPPAPGTRLLATNEHAGDVVFAAATEKGCELLAVLNLNHAEAAIQFADSPFYSLHRLPLPYSW